MYLKHLVIGAGEVGTAIYKIFKRHNLAYLIDKEDKGYFLINVIHICFPYSEKFVSEVNRYRDKYHPKYTIIHSTIPLGTMEKFKDGVYYSPVRGTHPALEKGLKTFTKYLSPPDPSLAHMFNRVGIKTITRKSPRDLEAFKLWDTTQYADFIRLQKVIYRYCQDNNLDFDFVYSEANKTYNEGYSKLGMKNVIRPILKNYPGQIGGHCLLPNCRLLNTEFTKDIIKFNETL